MIEIKDYPNYLINRNGKVFSKKHNKFLKTSTHKNGYVKVVLCKESKTKTLLVHRLVAEAYLKNPSNKKTVNHLNGVKTDNRLSNLEWSSHSENLTHAFKTGLKSSSYHHRDTIKKQFSKLVIDLETGIYYDSANDAAKSVSMNPFNLRAKLNGAIKNNTKFQYA